MMFTEGLDESAISWIKQGCDVKKSENRSPLSENYPLPRSPLAYSGTLHGLPPLKFYSGFLGASPTTVALSPDRYEDEYEDYDSESVGSGPEETSLHHLDEEMLNLKSEIESNGELGIRPNLIKGVSKENLRIELPGNSRRFTDVQSVFGVSNILLRGNTQPRSAYATPVGKLFDELGTPSAPPVVDIGGAQQAGHSEVADSSNGMAGIEDVFAGEMENSNDSSIEGYHTHAGTFSGQDKANAGEMESKVCLQQANTVEGHSPHYDTSNQNAWQVLLAYDACIRLCLNAWARGCIEAPDFLRDECKLLRSAFGLQKFLLQPRHRQSTQRNNNKSTEGALPAKLRKAVGKIRVEVKKLRVLPQRKLKSTNSFRGAIYLQVGADYVRHVSSVVKNRISSLKLHPILFTSEESLACLIHLRSSAEDTQIEPCSSVSLRPGSGDYHDFFPENQGDALLVEVQDSKKNVLGLATVPVASMVDNLHEKIRWWPVYLEDHECVGKVQLYINSTFTSDETSQLKNGPVVETLAYDLLLEAAMRAGQFCARNLGIDEHWKWLLREFSDYYGVSDSYTKLRYLSHVMDIATPTQDCLELVHKLLLPVIRSRTEKSLTRQEKTILLDCETRVESLLADVFQNYKTLDESSPTGLADISSPIADTAAPALAPAVQIYTLLHDVLAQDSQTLLKNYLQTAAAKRCRKHMVETDEFLSLSSEGLVMDSVTISTAYAKVKTLVINISNEIQADIKIHKENILPSSIDLSSITTAVYSTELYKRLKAFLAACPPSGPMQHVNELLIATADLERNLELWNIRMLQGGIDSRGLYHDYIMVWVEDLQLSLLEHCKAEKVPWSGVITNYSTSPFAEELFDKVKHMLLEYEVVIHRWPQYTLVLEDAVANVERAIIKALEKQYNDILTPLKGSVQKTLGMQVQKLARRQSTALYCIPSQLGTFLNTLKRILDVLHCQVEGILKLWASYLPENGERKTTFGEQLNGISVMLRTKYKNYLQAVVVKLASNMQANRSTRLQRILEETKETDGEAEIRERMQMLRTQLSDSICNLQEVFTSRIFIAICRGFWDKMGQIVLKFLEGRKENRVWYNGAYHALGILDDIFASQMQRLQGNTLQEKDLEPPRSITEARSILCRDTTNGPESSNYLYF
ncbi:hypothetical protein DM860_018215 [Cuscuta australis]|uniref:MHD1 domain-containing protein n=1 Tax=Cuscuta australis TaxID=267555 RepID=A0A328E3I9_9ASTE|nr:hypothetical protein DM860_018215 [Cuscuta australis]